MTETETKVAQAVGQTAHFISEDGSGFYTRQKLSCNCLVEKTQNYKCAAAPYNPNFVTHEEKIEKDLQTITKSFRENSTGENKEFLTLWNDDSRKNMRDFLKEVMKQEDYKKLENFIKDKQIAEKNAEDKAFTELLEGLDQLHSKIFPEDDETETMFKIPDSYQQYFDVLKLKLTWKKKRNSNQEETQMYLESFKEDWEIYKSLLKFLQDFLREKSKKFNEMPLQAKHEQKLEQLQKWKEFFETQNFKTNPYERKLSMQEHYFIYEMLSITKENLNLNIEGMTEKERQDFLSLVKGYENFAEISDNDLKYSYLKAKKEHEYRKKAEKLKETPETPELWEKFHEDTQKEEKQRIKLNFSEHFIDPPKTKEEEKESKFWELFTNDNFLNLKQPKLLLYKLPYFQEGDIKTRILTGEASKIFDEYKQKVLKFLQEQEKQNTQNMSTVQYLKSFVTSDEPQTIISNVKTKLNKVTFNEADYQSSHRWKSEKKSSLLQQFDQLSSLGS